MVSSSPTEIITKDEPSQVTNEKSTTQEINGDDYPSAINQGQLFTIIENGKILLFGITLISKLNCTGTMFDLIELNETEEQQQTTGTTTSSVPITINSSEAPNKKQTTKKPVIPTKNKANYATTTTPPNPTKHIQSVDEMEENLTKEFEMMPDIHDKSIKLNRTFRKELPPLSEEEEKDHDNLEKGSQFGVPRIVAFTVLNAVDDTVDNGYQADQPETEHNGNHTLKIPLMAGKNDETIHHTTTPSPNGHLIDTKNIDKKTVNVTNSPVNPVDPRIYMVDHHLSHANHTGEHNFSATATPQTNVTKKEYLPKSLLGEDAASTIATVQSTESGYSDHPFPSDEPKKVNRHRNLHTNKGRKFYPYFFSRMLG